MLCLSISLPKKTIYLLSATLLALSISTSEFAIAQFKQAETNSPLTQVLVKSGTYVLHGNELKAASEQAAPNRARDNRFRVYKTVHLLDMKRNAAAAREIQPLLEEESFKTIANKLYGQALYRSGLKNKAEPYLESAYKSAPGMPGAAEAYFDVLLDGKKYKEALMPGLVMLSLENPKNGRAPVVRRKLRTVLPHIPDKELKAAIHRVAMHIPEGSSQCSYYLALAHMCDRVGKRSLAINCYIPGLATKPENPGEYIRYARDLEMFNGNPQIIHEQYQRALKALPDHPTIVAAYRRYLKKSQSKKHDIAAGIKDAINWQLYK